MQHTHKRLLAVGGLLAVGLLLAVPGWTQGNPDPPDPVTAVTAAAEELAAAESEVRGLDRTIQRRTGEMAALDPEPADCDADRDARRLCRRHGWYRDVLADLGARKAAAEGRVAAAQEAAEMLAAPTLGARIDELDAEVEELDRRLTADELALGLEIARVEAAIPTATVPEVVHRTTGEIMADWDATACAPLVGVLQVPPDVSQGTWAWDNNAANRPGAIAGNLQWLADHEADPKPCHGLLAEWNAAGHPGSEEAGL